MCTFINLVTPEGVDPQRLKLACEAQGQVLRPSDDEGVLQVLSAGEAAWLTCESCDCESSLARSAPPGDEGKEEEKLRRKGWSAARIARWREQRGAHREQAAELVEARRAREVELWRALLVEVLASGVERVGLVVHWSSDEVRRGDSRGAPTAQALQGLELNVVSFFTPFAGPG